MNRAQRKKQLKQKKVNIKAAKMQRRAELDAIRNNEEQRQRHEYWMKTQEPRSDQLADKLKRYGGRVKGWF